MYTSCSFCTNAMHGTVFSELTELGECNALWSEHERVIRSICVAQAVSYSAENLGLPPKVLIIMDVYTGNDSIA